MQLQDAFVRTLQAYQVPLSNLTSLILPDFTFDLCQLREFKAPERRDMASDPTAAMRIPPQAPLSFIKTPASILEDTQDLVNQARRVQNQVLATIKPDRATFSTVLLPLAHAENYLALQAPLLALYQEISTAYVSSNPLRKAQNLLNDFNSESGI